MENSSDLSRFYKRIAIIFAGGVLLILALFFGVKSFLDYLAKPAYLDVMVLPESAKVSIDGTEYRNAIYTLEPGSYIAEVSGDGISGLTMNLELAKNQTTTIYLVWQNDTHEWKQYDSKEMAKRNSIGGVLPMYLSQCGTPATRTNCDAIAVKFGRNAECNNELCLSISGRRAELTDEVLELVRTNLQDQGYNLDDYQYFYSQNDAR